MPLIWGTADHQSRGRDFFGRYGRSTRGSSAPLASHARHAQVPSIEVDSHEPRLATHTQLESPTQATTLYAVVGTCHWCLARRLYSSSPDTVLT